MKGGGIVMKKLLKLVTVFTMLVALTGCVKVRYDLVIKDEKTVEGKMTFLIDDEQMGEATSDQEIVDQFKQSGVESEDIKAIHETVDGKQYSGIEASISKDEAKKITDSIEVKDGMMTYTLTDDSFENQEKAYGDVSTEEIKNMGFDITYTVTMPGEIESTDIGKKDGNVVTITIDDMLNFKGKAKIVANVGSDDNMLLYAGIVGAIAIIAGIVVLVMKKKKAGHEDLQLDEDVVENTTKESDETSDNQTNE